MVSHAEILMSGQREYTFVIHGQTSIANPDSTLASFILKCINGGIKVKQFEGLDFIKLRDKMNFLTPV